VICSAYYIAYLPLLLGMAFTAGKPMVIPDVVQFFMLWIHHSSSAANGFLYIALHSSVRRELRRYLPRCRRNTVATATIQPAGDGSRQRHCGIVDTDAEAPGAPVAVMTSSYQHVTERLETINL